MTITTKVIVISLSIALLFFQFFIVSGWVSEATNRHLSLIMHFWGYAMLVGIACNVAFLYHLTESGKNLYTS